MAGKILYEAEVSSLKLKGRKKRVLRSIVILICELNFLIFSCLAFGVFIGFAIYAIAIFFFLPTPFLKCPSKYQIIEQGVVYEGRIFPFKRGYSLRLNEKGRYISVCHGLKGEVLRLYTYETKTVFEILDRLLHPHA